MKNKIKVVGIMSGTSLDGVDFVLVEVQKSTKVKMKYLDRASQSFPRELLVSLKTCAQNKGTTETLAVVHHELGKFYSQSLKAISKKKKWKFDLIGLHGQTVFHSSKIATLQIGEPSYLAAEFAVPVVSDFRVADLSVGGEGAPLATLFHAVGLSDKLPSQDFAVNNLGGISNVTVVDKKKSVKLAFDTGPANMLMDIWMQKYSALTKTYDRDGEMAAQGIPNQKIVEQWIEEDTYFRKSPPKSCGREQYGEVFLDKYSNALSKMSEKDQMATLAEFTARSLTNSYKQFIKNKINTVVLCGGGAKNSYLKKRIQYHLPKVEILTTDDLGWPVESVEGAAFALLAAYRVWKIPANIPATTGAKKSVLLGKIVEI